MLARNFASVLISIRLELHNYLPLYQYEYLDYSLPRSPLHYGLLNVLRSVRWCLTVTLIV